MASFLRSATNNSIEQRDSNMNYHDMAKTLELTSQIQKQMESDNALEISDGGSRNGNRRKRLKAALEKNRRWYYGFSRLLITLLNLSRYHADPVLKAGLLNPFIFSVSFM